MFTTFILRPLLRLAMTTARLSLFSTPALVCIRRFRPFLRLSLIVAYFLAAAPLAQAQYQWSNFAGLLDDGILSGDGIGRAARFNSPGSVAADGSGNVYVADIGNHTIRKISSAGEVTTLAGLAGRHGGANGPGSAARFFYPSGIAADASGNVYVADTGNQTVRKISSTGVVTTLAGSPGKAGSADGNGSAARFHSPFGVAVDAGGNVYVADYENHTVRKISNAGEVTTLAGLAGSNGSADGTGSTARFRHPGGVAVDGSGNVYVADTENQTIRKITPGGTVTTLAGLAGNGGSTNATGSAARFDSPRAVAVDGSGTVYVADYNNLTIRQIAPGGGVTTLAGSVGSLGNSDGTGNAARFFAPVGVTTDGSGNVFVADVSTIRKIAPGGVVTTLAGLAAGVGNSDGIGSAARFRFATAAAVDASGKVYVADTGNHTIRKIAPDGAVTTLAGFAGSSGSADGTGSAARFNNPGGVAVDGNGNVYVADTGNHTIRKIAPGGAVTTLAGLAGNFGSVDATGSAARFGNPSGVATDSSGNVYVADHGGTFSTSKPAVRKITPGGVVTTLAPVNSVGVAVDGSGNVYVADQFHYTINRIAPGGEVTILAGSPDRIGYADATGSAARFANLSGVAVDGSGNVYVTDEQYFDTLTLTKFKSRIRKISSTGVVTTIGGGSRLSRIPADGIGTAASFIDPTGLAATASGVVFVVDRSAGRIIRGIPGLGTVNGATPTGAGLPGGTGFLSFTSPDVGVGGGKVITPSGQKLDAVFNNEGTVLLSGVQSVAVDPAGGSSMGLITRLQPPTGDAVLATIAQGAAATAENDQVLFAGLQSGTPTAMVRKGQAVPNLPGAALKSFLTLDGNGDSTFFSGGLKGGGYGGTAIFATSAMSSMARPENGPVAPGFRVLVYKGMMVGDRKVKIIATLVGQAGSLAEGRWRAGERLGVRLTFTDKSHALYLIPADAQGPGDWLLIARSGQDLAPDLSGALLQSINLPAYAPDATIFDSLVKIGTGDPMVTKMDNGVIFEAEGVDTAGPVSLRTLARRSRPVPVPAVSALTLFRNTLAGIGRASALVADATLTSDRSARTTLFDSQPDGTMQQIARIGSETPDGGRWARFVSVAKPDGTGYGALVSALLAVNKADGVTLKNKAVLYAVDSTGTMRRMLRTNDEIESAGPGSVRKHVKSFVSLMPAAGSIGAARGYDTQGRLSVLVSFTDRTQAVVTLQVP